MISNRYSIKFKDSGNETYRGSIAEGGGGRWNVEEEKIYMGLYAKVFIVGLLELAAEPF